MRVKAGTLLPLFALVALLSPSARGQQMHRVDRERVEAMLENVSADVQKYYYDAKLRGLDWNALVRDTRAAIAEAPDVATAQTEIAALLERLNDSHTRFIPPRTINTVDYGWKFKLFGDRCFVTEVSPKSDAERQGMKPGDEVLTIDGFAVDRASQWKLKYAMDVLMPSNGVNVDLRDPTGKLLHLAVASTIDKHYFWGRNGQMVAIDNARDRERARYKELGPELMILRIPEFLQIGAGVDGIFEKARNHKTLIVDLRGTPGGRIDSVMDYLSHVFGHEVKIGESIERDKVNPLTVKGNRKREFPGDLIVLIDSETASCGEVFARSVQLEERGTILGDHSPGHVMEAQYFAHVDDQNIVYLYGASVTVADMLMSDGKSLEHVGVKPDRVSLPTAADLAAGRDPVLAYAASLAGVTLTPEGAAKLFPH